MVNFDDTTAQWWRVITHLFSAEEVPDSMAVDEFGVMLANGVTTIRLMFGRPGHLTMRRDIEAGHLLGP